MNGEVNSTYHGAFLFSAVAVTSLFPAAEKVSKKAATMHKKLIK